MSATRIEPRLAERRREVREQGARSGLRRLLAWMTGLALVGSLGWLLQSPWLSVQHVEVEGARRLDAERALEKAGVRPGVPLVAVRPDRVEAALEADPWVAEAEVEVVFPTTVRLVVEERLELGHLARGDGWMVVATDGVVLGRATSFEGARLTVEAEEAHPGEPVATPAARSGVAFLAALPEEVRRQTEVWEGEGGGLWARVAGRTIRLGLPSDDMEARAAALVALLEDGLPEGARVDLLAPSRPAVEEPQPSS